jgi:hypothetical protein
LIAARGTKIRIERIRPDKRAIVISLAAPAGCETVITRNTILAPAGNGAGNHSVADRVVPRPRRSNR